MPVYTDILSKGRIPVPNIMQVDRTLLDKKFDRYVLAADGITKHATSLPDEVLAPLDAGESFRKAQWESRVHYNALTADPFLSHSYGASVAYYVSTEHQLMQATGSKTDTGVTCKKVYNVSVLTTRQENVSVEVAGKGLIVYCDGRGTLQFLKTDIDREEDKWNLLYKCAPWGIIPLLLLKAFYDEQHQQIFVVVAEPLSGNETDGAFRLSLLQLIAMEDGSDMTMDSSDTIQEHVTSEIAIVMKLPTYVEFSGRGMVVLVEGAYQLRMKLVAGKKEQASAEKPLHGTDTVIPYERRHDEDELEDDEMAALLSTLPRSGIGYHGEISKPKEASELASFDFNTPLSERFHKSSTTFSSVDGSLHGAADVLPHMERMGSSEGRSLEVPTAESILSGLEECDDSDPNAKGSLLLINCEQQIVQHQLDLDCRNFQFLCPSARTHGSSDLKSTLLFRNDIHGLVFELHLVEDRMELHHRATLPAFGFVQASKQEKKFMSCHPSGSFACIGEFERRLFVYQGNQSKEKERILHTRKQYIVEIGGQRLLGMQLVNESTILVLTSSHIYTLQLDV